jgi:hypothetical protein
MAVGGVFWSTSTVSNDDLVDAVDMENGELIAPGGIRACLASSMAQL